MSITTFRKPEINMMRLRGREGCEVCPSEIGEEGGRFPGGIWGTTSPKAADTAFYSRLNQFPEKFVEIPTCNI